MKAIVFTKYGLPDVLELKEIKKPVPKDNEVLVKVHAASVNDWDWGLIRGMPLIIRLFNGLFRPKRSNIPGTDIAGTVEAVGNKVNNLKPGDEVFGDLSESGFGGFAEYVCAKEDSLAFKSPKMTFEEAAAIPHAATLAFQGLVDKGKITTDPDSGEKKKKVLINGAGGGVGTFGIQMIRSANVEVTGVDSADKLDILKSIGYDQVIDYKTEDFTKNGKLYDLILDLKGFHPLLNYKGSLSPGGNYIMVGGSSSLILKVLIFGSIITLFSTKKMSILAHKPNKDLDKITELFDKGRLKTTMDGPYILNDVPDIMTYYGEAKHKGKIIIKIS